VYQFSGRRPDELGRQVRRFRLEDSRVSRRHAEVFIEGGTWVVRDLGSSNGTYVNGERIGRMTELEVDDELRFGRLALKVLKVDPEGIERSDRPGGPMPRMAPEAAAGLESAGAAGLESDLSGGSVADEDELLGVLADEADDEDDVPTRPAQPVERAEAPAAPEPVDEAGPDVDAFGGSGLLAQDLDGLDAWLAEEATGDPVDDGAAGDVDIASGSAAGEDEPTEPEQPPAVVGLKVDDLQPEQPREEQSIGSAASAEAGVALDDAADLEPPRVRAGTSESGAQDGAEIEPAAAEAEELRVGPDAAGDGDAAAEEARGDADQVDAEPEPADEARVVQAEQRVEGESTSAPTSELAEADPEEVEQAAAPAAPVDPELYEDDGGIFAAGDNADLVDISGSVAEGSLDDTGGFDDEDDTFFDGFAGVGGPSSGVSSTRSTREAGAQAAGERPRTSRTADAERTERQAAAATAPRAMGPRTRRADDPPGGPAKRPAPDRHASREAVDEDDFAEPSGRRVSPRVLLGSLIVLVLAAVGIGIAVTLIGGGPELPDPTTVAGGTTTQQPGGLLTEPEWQVGPDTEAGENEVAGSSTISADPFADGGSIDDLPEPRPPVQEPPRQPPVAEAPTAPTPATPEPGPRAPVTPPAVTEAQPSPATPAPPAAEPPAAVPTSDPQLAMIDPTPAPLELAVDEGLQEDVAPTRGQVEDSPDAGPGAEIDPGAEQRDDPPAMRGPGHRTAFLVDVSGSLVDTMPQPLIWLEQALQQLEAGEQFTVVYFREDEAIELPPGGMRSASSAAVDAAARWIEPGRVSPGGRSDAQAALRLVLEHEATDIYILSDENFGQHSGRDASPAAVIRELESVIEPAEADVRVHTVQFFYDDADDTLERIARRFNGTFEFVGEQRATAAEPAELLRMLTEQ
jgi:hypothetical protein